MSNFNGKCLIGVCMMLIITKVNANDVANAFIEHQIVPDVLKNPPTYFLKVTFENNLIVDKGNELTPTEVKKQPKVEYDADESGYYTLIMTDPDAPSRADPKSREFKHWLVTNIPGNNTEQGEVLAAYVGSGPARGAGLHRYVFLLHKQTGKLDFTEPHVPHNSRVDRPQFKAAAFSQKYNFSDPVAGNFYHAQYDGYVSIIEADLEGSTCSKSRATKFSLRCVTVLNLISIAYIL